MNRTLFRPPPLPCVPYGFQSSVSSVRSSSAPYKGRIHTHKKNQPPATAFRSASAPSPTHPTCRRHAPTDHRRPTPCPVPQRPQPTPVHGCYASGIRTAARPRDRVRVWVSRDRSGVMRVWEACWASPSPCAVPRRNRCTVLSRWRVWVVHITYQSFVWLRGVMVSAGSASRPNLLLAG
jgi:hypothetical protein